MLWVQALETFAFLRIFGNEASRQVEVKVEAECLPPFWLDCGTMGATSEEIATLGVFPALSACL